MSPMYQAPRGTQDILPDDQPYWRMVRDKVEELARRYGYAWIETPMFEATDLFVRGVGDVTDIVEKEMYTFRDKGDNSLTLRPEGTAPICRAYVQHGLRNRPQPVKLCAWLSAFRFAAPQTGRLREFHQFDCEAIGDMDPALDAELIDILWHLYTELGLSAIAVVLNSIGHPAPNCRPTYVQALLAYYTPREAMLCRECQARLHRNPLRLLDCKEPGCQPIADAAPRSVDYLCEECAAHFADVRHWLETFGVPYQVSHRLVRGLDYYTKTVFEVMPAREGAQSTLGGGGRYDGLIEELGGPPTPGVGFATGIERIILNLKEQGIPPPAVGRPDAYIAHPKPEQRGDAVRLLGQLRAAGISAVLTPPDKSLKAQLRHANNLNARTALVIGEDEVRDGSVQVKFLDEHRNEVVPQAEVAARLVDQAVNPP